MTKALKAQQSFEHPLKYPPPLPEGKSGMREGLDFSLVDGAAVTVGVA